jgi:hypothetical protein
MKKITYALVAGLLGVAFVATAPAVEARGLPTPPEVIRDVHQLAREHIRHVSRIVDHAVGLHDGYRRDAYRGYSGGVRYPRYYRPAYRYPVVVGGYRPDYYGGYVSGYVGLPSVGISVGVRPDQRGYRNDCDRNGYRDDDRRQRYDDDEDGD